MIPRLINSYPFTGSGIVLTDTISCKVTEERNGVFELEMVVATTTPYFEEIKEGRYILAKPNHTQGAQAFEIYEISRPILQRVTIRAHHISYRLSFIPVEPFSCTGITATLNGLVSHSMETNPFTFTTTITNVQSTYNQTAPASLRSRLGGTEGSVLDVFGGEYLWDNLTVNLLLHRGQDNGVQLRVAKNISALEQTTNLENVVTGALPYWSNEDGTVNLYGNIQYNSHVSDYDYKRTVILDLSEELEATPTLADLNTAAQQYVNQANLGIVNTNIKLSFVDLADTDEYQGSPLERVNLCDTVTVIYNPLSITYQAKAIRLTYDVLAERTLEVEVGDAKSTIAKTITDLVGDVSSVVTVGKKLISVTQKIDREIGSISSTVASVDESVNGEGGLSYQVSKIEQTASNISESVKTVNEKLDNGYLTKSEVENLVENTADSTIRTFSTTVTKANETAETVSTIQTYIKESADGIEIGKSNSQIVGVFGNDSLDFKDTVSGDRLAWVDATEGLGGTKLSVGDATERSKRWKIFTREQGTHLTFSRHN